jgi:hypothetical protein
VKEKGYTLQGAKDKLGKNRKEIDKNVELHNL